MGWRGAAGSAAGSAAALSWELRKVLQWHHRDSYLSLAACAPEKYKSLAETGARFTAEFGYQKYGTRVEALDNAKYTLPVRLPQAHQRPSISRVECRGCTKTLTRGVLGAFYSPLSSLGSQRARPTLCHQAPAAPSTVSTQQRRLIARKWKVRSQALNATKRS